MDLTELLKTGHGKYEIKTDIGGIFTLFADSTDIWGPAIGFKKKKNLRQKYKSKIK